MIHLASSPWYPRPIILVLIALAGLASPSAQAVDTLLMTEVSVTPSAGEFVEIYNPTASAIDLSNVYLTDAVFAPGSAYYYNIVTGVNAGGGGFSDFHARFPDGASIDPGAYQTVSLFGSDGFFSTYGQDPTYELYEDGVSADGIADMREAFAGSINNQGTLTNGGEMVIIYFWDGASDLVQDLDYLVWGDKAEAVDKTGVMIDGPDPDGDTSTYLADTAIATQDIVGATGHSFGNTWNRAHYGEGTETLTGGNGATGHDEMSENISVSWVEADPTPNAASATGWVFNEIHADPDAVGGDANGDAAVSASDDEFIELINNTGSAQDISGWTLSDGTSVRHTFAADTILRHGCGVVLFGGGTPTGTFGEAAVVTASTGGLDLDDAGDTLALNDGATDVGMATYGAEGGGDEAINLDPDIYSTPPYVAHSSLPASAGALFSPGTAVDGVAFDGCIVVAPTVAEIAEVQGAGATSPLNGEFVSLSGNVVTAVGVDGFFIQAPDTLRDADPDTSEGVFVETTSAPTVAVGDEVDVIGQVEEFFGFTQISNLPDVTVTGTATVPAPIAFDASTPSADPDAPSCTGGSLECFEGMLVQAAGIVTSPNQGFGTDPVAEFHGVATNDRPFREPGIDYPGLGGLPVFDGNPQIFEVDPDKLGGANVVASGGATYTATGPIAFEFGGYEIWTTAVSVDPPTQPAAVQPVRDKAAFEMTIGSLNMLRLFDEVEGPFPEAATDRVEDVGELSRQPEGGIALSCRLTKFSAYIRDVLRSPDVLAVQEVETIEVLNQLAAQITADDASVVYTGVLEEGNDGFGMDVGFLVRDTVTIDLVTQLGASDTLSCSGGTLHDRPPLLLEGTYTGGSGSFEFAAMAVHMRSRIGIDDPDDCNGLHFVRQKRLEQSQGTAQFVQDFQTANPAVPLVVLGDFNAFEFTDGYVDMVGQIVGDVDPAENLLSEPVITVPRMSIVTYEVDPADRYSFIFQGSAQAVDHAVVSNAGLNLIEGMAFGHGNSDTAEFLEAEGCDGPPATFDPALRSSDHDGLVLYLLADPSLIIFADGFESGDSTAWVNTNP